MNLEQLKAALKEGKITLEEYRRQALALIGTQLSGGAIDQAEHDRLKGEIEAEKEENPAGGGSGSISAAELQEAINKAVQSATDKVRTENAKKQKQLEDELEKVRREKMTEEERAKDDLERAKRDVAEREAALQAREVSLHTVDTLTQAKMPLEFRPFLEADTVENTTKRIQDFKLVWDKALEAAVAERFKGAGTDPNKGKGGGGGGDSNPFKQGPGYNMTKQGELLKTNPELAKKLMQEAGL